MPPLPVPRISLGECLRHVQALGQTADFEFEAYPETSLGSLRRHIMDEVSSYSSYANGEAANGGTQPNQA